LIIQVEAQLAHVKAVTGVELPKYYNPTAINPLKYAEQIKKRQMLWGAKKSEGTETPAASEEKTNPPDAEQQSSSVQKPPPPTQKQPQQQQQPSQQPSLVAGSYNKWETTNFGNSQTNEKFRRLMGIKGGAAPPVEEESTATVTNVEVQKLFADQEMEYERARAITHTQRGLGLGFASAPAAFKTDPNVTAPKPSTAGISFVKK